MNATVERLRQAAPYMDSSDARDALALCAENEALAAENARLEQLMHAETYSDFEAAANVQIKEEWGVRFQTPDGVQELDFPTRDRAAAVAAEHGAQLITRTVTDWASIGE